MVSEHAGSSGLPDGLEEADMALLIAMALQPSPRSQTAWGEAARSSLSGAGAKTLRRSLTKKQLGSRIERLVQQGLVCVVDEGWRTHYEMPRRRVFEVLSAAHQAGALGPAFEQVFRPTDRRFLYGEKALDIGRALLVLGRVSEAWTVVSSNPFHHRGSRESREWTLGLFGPAPMRTWLEAASDELLIEYSKAIGKATYEELDPVPLALDTVCSVLEARTLTAAKRFPVELLRGAVLGLPEARAAQFVGRGSKATVRKMELVHAFARGELAEAYALGKALAHSQPGALRGFEAFFFALSAVDAARRGVSGAWALFNDVLDGRWPSHRQVFPLLDLFRMVESGAEDPNTMERQLADVFYDQGASWPTALAGGLVVRWLDLEEPPGLALELARYSDTCGIQSVLIPQTLRALAGHGTTGPNPNATLVNAHEVREPWERVVDQFEVLAERLTSPVKPDADAHAKIVWEVEEAQGVFQAEPRLISSARSPRGRALRIHEVLSTHAEVADQADIAVADAWCTLRDELEMEFGYAKHVANAHRLLSASAVHALIGHPRVRKPDRTPISIVAGRATIVVAGEEHDARIFVEPEGLAAFPLAFSWDGPTRLVAYQLDESSAFLLQALRGTTEGRVPRQAVSRLLPAITRLAGHVRIEGRGTVDLQGQEVSAESAVEVDLAWKDPTLSIELGCWPLGRGGPRCVPGVGPQSVLADTDGQFTSTTRDLEAERAALAALEAVCPKLVALGSDDVATPRVALGLEAACHVLEELTRATEEGLTVLGWPAGEPLRLTREVGSRDFVMDVGREKNNWLTLNAGVSVDENEVLAWRLLAHAREGSGRFVRLESGEVLKLSKALGRKLDALERLDQRNGEAATLQIPEVALPALEGLLGGDEGVTFAESVVARKQEIESALRSKPRIPGGLKATLRDYQREGVCWMLRLARAGFGGVLADDMGLGKTIQSLAVLLARKKLGPALVICPTSVIGNWVAETSRFAPSLKVVELGETPSGERAAALRALGTGDLAVMSYGVLSRMEEELEGLSVATLVFDEAHALKNARSTRAQAASVIDAGFRLGLTGTPIENHLGELWSVMNVCVPGLLGDEDAFRRGVARAIEQGDSSAADDLRALVRPFLLRRTKEMVLTELPARTEHIVMVTPGKRELAWYEAQRRMAQERTQKSEGDPKGQARFRMLAEIGKLRQAAVEPRLIDDSAPKGAKLQQVVERTQALVEAGHKVLVFTQFLGVLAMLDGRLRLRGVRTLELQGSTAAAARAKRVAAFQAGEADVFLMSLKAGGIGVNLTAADYVIHVDPWWNPAVEDQATARAHRMGQSKPVTVYHFCTEGSIEPKIFDLHERKRDLAEDILEGMAKKKRLDLDELQALMS